jgi:tetratricopeptide (TPR) repeat protein
MAPSLKEVKAALSAAGVDYSRFLEKSEYLERFRELQVEAHEEAVSRLKAKANFAFKRRSYAHAVRLYTIAALKTVEKTEVEEAQDARATPLAMLLSNRSAAYLQLKLPRRALRDAEHALRLDPGYTKAYARYAAACTELGRLGQAKATLEEALRDCQDEALRRDLGDLLATATTAASLLLLAAAGRRRSLPRPRVRVHHAWGLVTHLGRGRQAAGLGHGHAQGAPRLRGPRLRHPRRVAPPVGRARRLWRI